MKSRDERARRALPFIRNFCNIYCSVLLFTALLSNLNIYSPFRLQTTDIMVTQPSTCLQLSENMAGAITWWRRLPEKFCRYPIVIHDSYFYMTVKLIVCKCTYSDTLTVQICKCLSSLSGVHTAGK